MSNRLVVSYLFLISLGFLGAHRLYLGKWFTGTIYFLTAGFCGLGLIFDFFALPFMVKDDCRCQ